MSRSVFVQGLGCLALLGLILSSFAKPGSAQVYTDDLSIESMIGIVSGLQTMDKECRDRYKLAEGEFFKNTVIAHSNVAFSILSLKVGSNSALAEYEKQISKAMKLNAQKIRKMGHVKWCRDMANKYRNFYNIWPNHLVDPDGISPQP